METATGIQETISDKETKPDKLQELEILRTEDSGVLESNASDKVHPVKDRMSSRTNQTTAAHKELVIDDEENVFIPEADIGAKHENLSDSSLHYTASMEGTPILESVKTETQLQGTAADIGAKHENHNDSSSHDTASMEGTPILESVQTETQLQDTAARGIENAISNIKTVDPSGSDVRTKQIPEYVSFKDENVKNKESINFFGLPSHQKNSETHYTSSEEVEREAHHSGKDDGAASTEQHIYQLDTLQVDKGQEIKPELADSDYKEQEAVSQVFNEDNLELDVACELHEVCDAVVEEKAKVEAELSGNPNFQCEEQDLGTDETALQDEADKKQIVTNNAMLLKDEMQVNPQEKVADLDKEQADDKEALTTEAPKTTESQADASSFHFTRDGAEVEKGDNEIGKRGVGTVEAMESTKGANHIEDVSPKAENKPFQEGELQSEGAILTSEASSEEQIQALCVANASDKIPLTQHIQEEDQNKESERKINNENTVTADASPDDQDQETNEENTGLNIIVLKDEIQVDTHEKVTEVEKEQEDMKDSSTTDASKTTESHDDGLSFQTPRGGTDADTGDEETCEKNVEIVEAMENIRGDNLTKEDASPAPFQAESKPFQEGEMQSGGAILISEASFEEQIQAQCVAIENKSDKIPFTQHKEEEDQNKESETKITNEKTIKVDAAPDDQDQETKYEENSSLNAIVLKDEIQVDPHEKVTKVEKEQDHMKDTLPTDASKTTESHDDALSFQIPRGGTEVDKGDSETGKKDVETVEAMENIRRDNLTKEDASPALLKAENKPFRNREMQREGATLTPEASSQEEVQAQWIANENKSSKILLTQHKEEEDQNKDSETKINNEKPIIADAALDDQERKTRNGENPKHNTVVDHQSGEQINENTSLNTIRDYQSREIKDTIPLASEARDIDELLKDNSNIERGQESHYVSHTEEASSSRKEVDAKLEKVTEVGNVDDQANDFTGSFKTATKKHQEISNIDQENAQHQYKIDLLGKTQKGKQVLPVAQTQREERLKAEGSNELIRQEKFHQFSDLISDKSVSTVVKSQEEEIVMPKDECSHKMTNVLCRAEASTEENVHGAPPSVEEKNPRAEENQSIKKEETVGISKERCTEYASEEEKIAKADEKESKTKREIEGMKAERSSQQYPKRIVSEAPESSELRKKELLNEQMDKDIVEKDEESSQQPEESSGNRAVRENFNEAAYQLKPQEREEDNTAGEMTNTSVSNDEEEAKIDEKREEIVPQLEPEDHNHRSNGADGIDEDSATTAINEDSVTTVIDEDSASTVQNPYPDDPTEEEETDRKNVEERDKVIENEPLQPVSQNFNETAHRMKPQKREEENKGGKMTNASMSNEEVAKSEVVDKTSKANMEEQRNIEIYEAEESKIEISTKEVEAVVAEYQPSAHSTEDTTKNGDPNKKDPEPVYHSEEVITPITGEGKNASNSLEVSNDIPASNEACNQPVGEYTVEASSLDTNEHLQETIHTDLNAYLYDPKETTASAMLISQSEAAKEDKGNEPIDQSGKSKTQRQEDDQWEKSVSDLSISTSTKESMQKEKIIAHPGDNEVPTHQTSETIENEITMFQGKGKPTALDTLEATLLSNNTKREQLAESHRSDHLQGKSDGQDNQLESTEDREAESAVVEPLRDEVKDKKPNMVSNNQDLELGIDAPFKGILDFTVDEVAAKTQCNTDARSETETEIMDKNEATKLKDRIPELTPQCSTYAVKDITDRIISNEVVTSEIKTIEPVNEETPCNPSKNVDTVNSENHNIKKDNVRDLHCTLTSVEETFQGLAEKNKEVSMFAEVHAREASTADNETVVETIDETGKGTIETREEDEKLDKTVNNMSTLISAHRSMHNEDEEDTVHPQVKIFMHQTSEATETKESVILNEENSEALEIPEEKNKEASRFAKKHIHGTTNADKEIIAEPGISNTEDGQEEKSLDKTVDDQSTSTSTYGHIHEEEEHEAHPQIKVLVPQNHEATDTKENTTLNEENLSSLNMLEEKNEGSCFGKEHVQEVHMDNQTIYGTGNARTEIQEEDLHKSIDGISSSSSVYESIQKEEKGAPLPEAEIFATSQIMEMEDNVILNENKATSLDILEGKYNKASGSTQEHLHGVFTAEAGNGLTDAKEEDKNLDDGIDDLAPSNSGYGSIQEEEDHPPEVEILMHQTGEDKKIKEGTILSEKQPRALELPEVKNDKAAGFADKHIQEAIHVRNENIPEAVNAKAEIREVENLDKTVEDFSASDSTDRSVLKEGEALAKIEVFMQTSEARRVKESLILNEEQSMDLDVLDEKNKEAPGLAKEHAQRVFSADKEKVAETGNGQTAAREEEENLDITVDDSSNTDSAYGSIQNQEEEAYLPEFEVTMDQFSQEKEIKRSAIINQKQSTDLRTPEMKNEEASDYFDEHVHEAVHIDNGIIPETGTGKTVVQEQENSDKTADDMSTSDSVYRNVWNEEEEAHPPEDEVLVKESVNLNEEKSKTSDMSEEKKEDASGFDQECVHATTNVGKERVAETGNGTTEDEEEKESLDRTVNDLSTSNSAYRSIQKEEEEAHPPDVEVLNHHIMEATENKESFILNKVKSAASDTQETNLPSNSTTGEQLAEVPALDMQDNSEGSEINPEARDNEEEENSVKESPQEAKHEYPKNPNSSNEMELQINIPFQDIMEPNTEEIAGKTPCNMCVESETETEIVDENEAIELDKRTQELITPPQTHEGEDNIGCKVVYEEESSEHKAIEEIHKNLKLVDPKRVEPVDSENKKKNEELHGIPTLYQEIVKELELENEKAPGFAERIQEAVHKEAITETGRSKTEIQEVNMDRTFGEPSTSTTENESMLVKEEAHHPEIEVLIHQTSEATKNRESVILKEEKPMAINKLESILSLNITVGGSIAESQKLEMENDLVSSENQLESRDNGEEESSTKEVANEQPMDPSSNKSMEHDTDSPFEDIMVPKPEEMIAATSCNIYVGHEVERKMVNKNEVVDAGKEAPDLTSQHQTEAVKDITESEVSNQVVFSEIKVTEAAQKTRPSKNLDTVELEGQKIKDTSIEKFCGTPTSIEEVVQELEEKNKEASGSAEEHVHADNNTPSGAPKENADSMARPFEPEPRKEIMVSTENSKIEISLENKQQGETLSYLSTSLATEIENTQKREDATFVKAGENLCETKEVTESQEIMELEEEERTQESPNTNLSISTPEYEEIVEAHSLLMRHKSERIYMAEMEIPCPDLPEKEVQKSNKTGTNDPAEDIKNHNQEEEDTKKKQVTTYIECEMVYRSSKEDSEEGIGPEEAKPDAAANQYHRRDHENDKNSEELNTILGSGAVENKLLLIVQPEKLSTACEVTESCAQRDPAQKKKEIELELNLELQADRTNEELPAVLMVADTENLKEEKTSHDKMFDQGFQRMNEEIKFEEAQPSDLPSNKHVIEAMASSTDKTEILTFRNEENPNSVGDASPRTTNSTEGRRKEEAARKQGEPTDQEATENMTQITCLGGETSPDKHAKDNEIIYEPEQSQDNLNELAAIKLGLEQQMHVTNEVVNILEAKEKRTEISSIKGAEDKIKENKKSVDEPETPIGEKIEQTAMINESVKLNEQTPNINATERENPEEEVFNSHSLLSKQNNETLGCSMKEITQEEDEELPNKYRIPAIPDITAKESKEEVWVGVAQRPDLYNMTHMEKMISEENKPHVATAQTTVQESADEAKRSQSTNTDSVFIHEEATTSITEIKMKEDSANEKEILSTSGHVLQSVAEEQFGETNTTSKKHPLYPMEEEEGNKKNLSVEEQQSRKVLCIEPESKMEEAQDDPIQEQKAFKPTKFQLSDLLKVSAKDTTLATQNLKEEQNTELQHDLLESKMAANGDDEEVKVDKEEENDDDEEQKGSEVPVLVEASGETGPRPSSKKSHNILSGVGSKVRRSIAKVKKVITGKSAHTKTASPK